VPDLEKIRPNTDPKTKSGRVRFFAVVVVQEKEESVVYHSYKQSKARASHHFFSSAGEEEESAALLKSRCGLAPKTSTFHCFLCYSRPNPSS
jgi:hypothetical protein